MPLEKRSNIESSDTLELPRNLEKLVWVPGSSPRHMFQQMSEVATDIKTSNKPKKVYVWI
jgi:hypothetical protein